MFGMVEYYCIAHIIITAYTHRVWVCMCSVYRWICVKMRNQRQNEEFVLDQRTDAATIARIAEDTAKVKEIEKVLKWYWVRGRERDKEKIEWNERWAKNTTFHETSFKAIWNYVTRHIWHTPKMEHNLCSHLHPMPPSGLRLKENENADADRRMHEEERFLSFSLSHTYTRTCVSNVAGYTKKKYKQ